MGKYTLGPEVLFFPIGCKSRNAVPGFGTSLCKPQGGFFQGESVFNPVSGGVLPKIRVWELLEECVSQKRGGINHNKGENGGRNMRAV